MANWREKLAARIAAEEHSPEEAALILQDITTVGPTNDWYPI